MAANQFVKTQKWPLSQKKVAPWLKIKFSKLLPIPGFGSRLVASWLRT
jgi:hypothetical protein